MKKVTRRHLQEALATGTKTRTPRKVAKEFKQVILREDLTFQPAGLIVDREAHVIHNVKILGWKSKNKNRRYSPEGIDVSLYEGAVVNIDHPGSEDTSARPLSARFGEVTGISKNTDGVFAESLHYNPHHPLTEAILYMAEKKPHLFGCSQNAFGDVYEDAHGEVVETVTDVRSIDLVSEPASTKGLFEATDEEKLLEKDTDGDKVPDAFDSAPLDPDVPVADDSMSDLPPVTDDAPVPDVDDPATPEDESLDEPEEIAAAAHGINITDEMMSAGTKILQSYSDGKMDIKGVLNKFKALLTGHAAVMSEAVMKSKLIKTLQDAKKFLTESKDPAVRRSGRAVVEKLEKFEVREVVMSKKEKAKQMCEAAKLPDVAITPFFLTKLTECKSDKEMQEAIEDRRVIAGLKDSSKPRSANGEILESVGPVIPEGETAEQAAAREKKMEDDFLHAVLKK